MFHIKRLTKPGRFIDSVVVSAALLCMSAPSFGAVSYLDSFQVIKNGNTLFYDDFADGIAPPSSPVIFASGPAVYTHLQGTFVDAGGKLKLDTSTGPITSSATGDLNQVTRATLQTNINPDPAFLANGLKIDDTFSVTGVFDLTSLPANTGFAVRLVDRDSTGSASAANDFVEMGIRSNASGILNIRFREQDFILNTATTFAQIALSSVLPIGANQIALTVSRNNLTNNSITGSWAFFDDGLWVGGGAFNPAIAPAIFDGENYTRAEFIMSAPIPEPEIYAMLGAGLGLIGWIQRRRKLQAA